MEYEHSYRRAIAHLVDLIITALPIIFVFERSVIVKGNEALSTSIAVLLFTVYMVLFEGIYGQTLGKKLFKLKVLKEDGEKCDLKAALIRNVLRIVDALPNLYIVGILVIAFTKKKQRIGDLAAKTVVVRE